VSKETKEQKHEKVSYIKETALMAEEGELDGIILIRFKDGTSSALMSIEGVDPLKVISVVDIVKFRLIKDYKGYDAAVNERAGWLRNEESH
jgi:hypothetical protein